MGTILDNIGYYTMSCICYTIERGAFMAINPKTESPVTSCPERTPLSRRPLLTEGQTESLESLFKVLGSRNRLRLVHALVKAGEMCVGDLAKAIEMQTQAVSNQLKNLALLDVVIARRDGNNVYYSVIDDCVITMIEQGLCQLSCASGRHPERGS
jgi:ArsR family transcriptional regulator, lead/cadmium/zinc/bismuth-responsive transcriptional repressor